VGNIAFLRDRCRELAIPVGYTAQPGGMTEEQRGLLKDFWGPGMRVDPVDREVVEPLGPQDGDWVFTKWRYSAFFQSDLFTQDARAGPRPVDRLRVLRHVGVLMSAVDAFTQ